MISNILQNKFVGICADVASVMTPEHSVFALNTLQGCPITNTAFEMELRIDGEIINVTPKEFDLLVCLVQNKGVALSRERILMKVWNYDYYGEDRTVDTHIKMLRGHLKDYRDCIVTVWGVGYKFEPKE